MRYVKMMVPLFFVLGCGHNKNQAREDQFAGNQPANTYSQQSSVSAAPAVKSCNGDGECSDRQLCIRSSCIDISASLAECSMSRVHFDVNQADIRDEDRSRLDRVVRCLKADQSMQVTIEGNADERGPEGYNVALGDRRASAVAKYLTSQGVSDAQLRTLSYGDLNPLCVEHDEDCWSKNRRAAIKPKMSASRDNSGNTGNRRGSALRKKGTDTGRDPANQGPATQGVSQGVNSGVGPSSGQNK